MKMLKIQKPNFRVKIGAMQTFSSFLSETRHIEVHTWHGHVPHARANTRAESG